MASLFIGKYRTFGGCKPAISRVAHAIEKIKPACSAYLERTDPLPSIHLPWRPRSSNKAKLIHVLIVVVREVVLKRIEMTTRPARPLFPPFTGFSLVYRFSVYLPLTTFWVYPSFSFHFSCLFFCDFIIITRQRSAISDYLLLMLPFMLPTRSLSA